MLHATCYIFNATCVQVLKCYKLEDFPEEVRQAWGISDKDFKEIKSQLVGKPLPPARITQHELDQKGYISWGHYKGVAAIRAW